MVLHGGATQQIGILNPTTGSLDDVELPYTHWQPTIRVLGHYLVGIASSAVLATAVVRVDLRTGEPLGLLG